MQEFKGPRMDEYKGPNMLNKSRGDLPIAIREPSEADVSFLFSSWLKSNRKGTFCNFVDDTIYYNEQHKLVERLLLTSKVLMAVDPSDAGNILGYIVYETIDNIMVIHYAYTKHTYRCMGVFNALFAATGHDRNLGGAHTHSNPLGGRLAMKFNLIYHPYILLNYKTKETKAPESSYAAEVQKQRA